MCTYGLLEAGLGSGGRLLLWHFGRRQRRCAAVEVDSLSHMLSAYAGKGVQLTKPLLPCARFLCCVQWRKFTNPARGDGLELEHWVKCFRDAQVRGRGRLCSHLHVILLWSPCMLAAAATSTGPCYAGTLNCQLLPYPRCYWCRGASHLQTLESTRSPSTTKRWAAAACSGATVLYGAGV